MLKMLFNASFCYAVSMKSVILIILAIGALIAGVIIFQTPGLRPVVIYPYEPPTLKANETTHDLGTIKTDSKVDTTFYLYNTGGKHLRISRIDTSCGCTVADISKKVIPPGDFAMLKTTLDTSIKLGKIKKTITIISNDGNHPETTLYLVGNVIFQMKGHEKMAVKDPLVLFQGECATCHVNKGKGKVGRDLFVADCAMCHGLNGEGVLDIAPSLLARNYKDEATMAHVRNVIANGSKNTPEMPPFGEVKGGPLNEEEVESLVRYLKYQSTRKVMESAEN